MSKYISWCWKDSTDMENILNVIVAASNYPVVYPIMESYRKHDLVTSVMLANLAFASTVSHLVESHKHGMIGFGISKSVSELWNLYDRISSYIAVARLLYLVFSKYSVTAILTGHKLLLLRLCLSLCLGIISEYDKYNKSLRPIYIIAHTLWHITIYMVIFDIYRITM